MKLYEYQAVRLLGAAGIPVQEGAVAGSPEEARSIAARIAAPVMVKAQVLVGGRGKAGGVKLARDPEEARAHAERILGMSIKGVVVRRVLVSRAVDIASEYYLGLVTDRASKTVQCMASASGGMEIEEVAASTPERIVRFPVDPVRSPGGKDRFDLLGRAFPRPEVVEQARTVLGKMLRVFADADCSLLEINPLALEPTGRLVAADAKIVLDDNALYRHPELESMRSSEEYSAEEMEAHAAGLAFVGLDGAIGCIVNGAGLAMATMDLIKSFGGTPANFLDVGGSSSPDKELAALRILLRNPRIAAVLINIFGGITRCDDVARGILLARGELGFPVPLVVRLIGTNENEGRAILRGAGIDAYEDLSTAVRAAVAAAGARQGAAP